VVIRCLALLPILVIVQAFRVIFTGCSLAIIGVSAADGGWDFEYYTTWNYTALAVVIGTLALHSFVSCFGWTFPKHLRRFAWALFQIELANVFMVDVLFWSFLADGYGDFININVHGLNAAIMIIELLLNDIVSILGCVDFAVILPTSRFSSDSISLQMLVPYTCRMLPKNPRTHARAQLEFVLIATYFVCCALLRSVPGFLHSAFTFSLPDPCRRSFPA
jgi:hypothetical protein